MAVCAFLMNSGYIEMIRIRDLPNNPTCPKCESSFLGVLHIEEDAAYQLISTEGKIIQSGNIICQGEQTSLKLDGLKSGTYLIHITDGEKRFIQRIIKQ